MAKLLGIYKCEVCGNMVEVIWEGAGELVCCGQPMKLMEENSVDASLEKHVPVAETEGDLLTVKVGSAVHPMTEEHYIQWIEVLIGDKVCRASLKPGMAPEASFRIPDGSQTIVLRAYCNLHGLWKG
ncbi:MAG TPA: desulfoferrodoxin [Syntrophomonadaceae bacterium]|nr:desulfoferrodoxin [Syntrophomonadaceae bacterium]